MNRIEQVFDVAFGASYRALDQASLFEAQVIGKRDHLLHGALSRLLVAHDTAFSDVRSSHFKLRLDQRDDSAAGAEDLPGGRKDELERNENETSIVTSETIS